jgi:hypothetical protein
MVNKQMETISGFIPVGALVIAIIALIVAISAKGKANTSVQQVSPSRAAQFSFCSSVSGNVCASTGSIFNILPPPNAQNQIFPYYYIIGEPSLCNLTMTEGTFGGPAILKIINPAVAGCAGGVASVTYLDSFGTSATLGIAADSVQEFLMIQPSLNSQNDWAFVLGNYRTGIGSLTQFGSMS